MYSVMHCYVTLYPFNLNSNINFFNQRILNYTLGLSKPLSNPFKSTHPLPTLPWRHIRKRYNSAMFLPLPFALNFPHLSRTSFRASSCCSRYKLSYVYLGWFSNCVVCSFIFDYIPFLLSVIENKSSVFNL